mmetsp:Transcript_66947/g.159739  ORF Transcript_66947/g.159739 Transcript_66947/m.159739 type:complete len:211 (+) Transcript_66947:2169-2801(+)
MANTPLVCCHGCSRHPDFWGSSIVSLPPPQMGCTESVPSLSTAKCASMTMYSASGLWGTLNSTSTFSRTLPLRSSFCSMDPPAGSDARRQTLSLDAAAATYRACAPASLLLTIHSDFPARFRASTSLSLSTKTEELSTTKSSTFSPKSFCQLRSPAAPFQACTRPVSVALMSPRPAGRSSAMGSVDATLRHCSDPSCIDMEATTPDCVAA